jgi:hypothetical protein
MMTDDAAVDMFVSLFRGRGDCYGSESGGCVRSPLNREVFRSHLENGPSIGVYPAVPTDNDAICVWGCTDIDVEDLSAARLMQRTLNAAGIHAWVERSRSKGYHVWVFSRDIVPAEDMRRMLLVAHHVADYPAIEVNPKQSDVSASKVGNYVRLPYPHGLIVNPDRRTMLDDDDKPITLRDWLAQVSNCLTDPSDIRRISAMYVPPKTQRVIVDWDSDENLDDALRMASPLARIIWRDGPLPSQDRSKALMRLAYVCSESGIAPSMCHVIVSDADKRWGKFHLRGDTGLEQIAKIVERAYGKHGLL